MSGGIKKAKDLAPVIGDAINWYYIIGNCESDCDKDPNKHICTQDKWDCCWTVLSWLGGFDARCRTACNRTTRHLRARGHRPRQLRVWGDVCQWRVRREAQGARASRATRNRHGRASRETPTPRPSALAGTSCPVRR